VERVGYDRPPSRFRSTVHSFRPNFTGREHHPLGLEHPSNSAGGVQNPIRGQFREPAFEFAASGKKVCRLRRRYSSQKSCFTFRNTRANRAMDRDCRVGRTGEGVDHSVKRCDGVLNAELAVEMPHRGDAWPAAPVMPRHCPKTPKEEALSGFKPRRHII
jgi:hypothetical protein